MTYTISGNRQVNIDVGSYIRVLPGYLPAQYNGQLIEIVKVDASFPYFFDGSQESAITPAIIDQVLS